MKTAIDQDTLHALVQAQALREVRAMRHGDGWKLQGRISTRWLDVRSRREPVRVWRSLDALERFCTAAGIPALAVEL